MCARDKLQDASDERLSEIIGLWDYIPNQIRDTLHRAATLAAPRIRSGRVDAADPPYSSTAGYESELLRNTKAVYTVIDVHGNILYANQAARNAWKLSCGNANLSHISEFIDDTEPFMAHARAVIENCERHGTVRIITFRDQYGKRCADSELHYIQTFPIPQAQCVGQIVLPLREIMDMASELLDDVEVNADCRVEAVLIKCRTR